MPASERASPLFVKTLVAGASITPSNGLQAPARNAWLKLCKVKELIDGVVLSKRE